MSKANELKNNLRHSRSAYLHAIRALPSPDALKGGPVKQFGMEFRSINQITSQEIELGWAFFCRYEGCLEYWLKAQGIPLKKNKQLKDWLIEQNIEIPASFLKGIECYRKIRNQLHHNDGASFDGTEKKEIHLLPEHMDNFFDLFCWIGEQVDRVSVS